MLFRRSRCHLLSMIGACLLALTACSRGEGHDAADTFRPWRDFGTLLLSRVGTGRCPSAEWLGRKLDVVDPDSGRAVRIAENALTDALRGYGQSTIAVAGRIPLYANPQCLLGLYCMDRFPETQLGEWGRRQFEQCVEHACAVAMPATGTPWPERLEGALSAAGKDPQDPFATGALGRAEMPYVWLYLVVKARSADARHKAVQELAHSLSEEYGLEPGLRQCLVLWDEGSQVEGTWLIVARQLEAMGSHRQAKRLYEQILRDATLAEEARTASEGYARILISESRRREAKAGLSLLFRRFPNVEYEAADIRTFVREFQIDREETARKCIDELTQATGEFQSLQLCRLLEALWTPEETPSKWQTIVDGARPGSLVERLGRVFLAKALLGAGKIDASQAALRGLTESVNPFMQAQSVAVSAHIARVRGDMRESARLYSRAVQIDRPTLLPGWYKRLVQVSSLDAGMPDSELQVWLSFLQGCNSLIDGDFGSAIDSLSPIADPRSLPDSLLCVVPCVMMLAHLGLGDYPEAEAWGYQALDARRRSDPDDSSIEHLLAKAQDLDTAVCQLTAHARSTFSDSSASSTVPEQAVRVYRASVNLEAAATRAQAKGDEVQSVYVQARKRQITRILEAEYDYAGRQMRGAGRTERVADLEPLLFVAQVLSENSFDRIKENLASLAKEEDAKGRVYRFAVFAQRIKRPDLMTSALDDVAKEQTSAASAEILESIAEMYLAASSPQKAVDMYRMIAKGSQDPDKAQSAQRKIISICAETLKDYGRAIQECEEFVKKHPDSPETSQVEFLTGQFAYLNEDYSGAVAQLEAFQKRYPKHPQVGQAIMLTGLGRLAEGNTEDAIARFREVIRRFPEGDLAAHSKFLIGYAQISEQQYSAATETLKQLIEQFPNSKYVVQARTLMDRLNKVSQ